jgi:hypothetical protein
MSVDEPGSQFVSGGIHAAAAGRAQVSDSADEIAVDVTEGEVSSKAASGTSVAASKATPRGKSVPKIATGGYIIVADAVQQGDGWMPSATIHDDRPDVDTDDVTDDYRVMAPNEVRYATRKEALEQAEILGRTWVAQRG